MAELVLVEPDWAVAVAAEVAMDKGTGAAEMATAAAKGGKELMVAELHLNAE